MISSKSKTNGKTAKPAPPAKVTPVPAEPRPIGRRASPQVLKGKSVDWVHVHFSERRGYKRVHVGHKYSPNEHATLCQRLREGKLGSGYYMQVEDPSAPTGSLQEVLHPQDIDRVNFDTLDAFMAKLPASETPEVAEELVADEDQAS
jgi:hypothetical protein